MYIDEYSSAGAVGGGGVQSPSGGGGSSTASSRDTSPCRELSPLVTNLKPPIIIRRGPRGFGFTVHTIRVYYGDTDFYTMHHLVMVVDEGSPAFEAGLRLGDLITHVNGEAVQGLYHTQVLQLLLSGTEYVTLRATPLEHTSIQSGGRKRELWQSKLAKKGINRQQHKKQQQHRKDNDKKRKTSLFRKISTKRASAEMQQLAAGIGSPTMVTPSRSFQSFTRCNSQQQPVTTSSSLSSPCASDAGTPPLSSQLQRLSLSPLDTFALQASGQTASSSSQSSSPSSTAPNTPTGGGITPGNTTGQLYQRPSTLHGLKHKLHTTGAGGSSGSGNSTGSAANKTGLHCANAANSGPNRRKSVGHIPLSPLARTPSPSPMPASPTRSPSPLAFPIGHQPGSSNTTQSYSPGGVLPSSTATTQSNASGSTTMPKKSFARPKSAEPSSPLLRRALSPDRLHPRSAENKCSISPLCCSGSASNSSAIKQRPVAGVWRTNTVSAAAASAAIPTAPTQSATTSHLLDTYADSFDIQFGGDHVTSAASTPTTSTTTTGSAVGTATGLTLSLQQPGELLPRIAEEKDSPTSSSSSHDVAQILSTDADKKDVSPPTAGKSVKSKSKQVSGKKN